MPTRLKMYKAWWLALPLACLLHACGSGSPDGTPVIGAQDRDYGEEAHPQLLAEFGGAYAGDEAAYVRTVGERVGAAAGLAGECTFTLVNSDVVNAFAVPGCYIYVTRGLVAIVTSEAELASVLGHEVGHIVGRHAQRQQQRSIWRSLGVIAAQATGSERLTRLASQASQLFGLRYSRKQEYEADDLGVRYLEDAGYDVYAAADMLTALQRHDTFMAQIQGRDGARSLPEWALSHPLTERRVERTRAAARQTSLKDDELPEGADRYLNAVDGMLYGDDPEQGFVLDRQFAHPIMRIAFEAPVGFSLTNSPQAVRLTGPHGISGEFGGGPLGTRDVGSYAEALVSRILGDAPAEVSDVRETTVNGLSAVITQVRVAVRDGNVPMSVAVYDGGDGQAYHFIIVSPPANTDHAAVNALFRSFRRLTKQEATALRPRFVRTVAVGPDDTPDTLSRRVADPASRALFDLLNGRDGNAPLKLGTRVKIVTHQSVP
ncbi:M48 family metalloprotease [Sphingomonas sp. MG17]|uniref:M48 family metalloprotease n=1 Tax=Sphingomonas tagetis TaxID=2949092 RepID=A0A9X2HKU1_9SPHN|nr:M48 family metalloprotease [Sphingomonas tagetis]MCP3731512.1 M48 family metalloprotease [Sphingomonas tagetis]